jgi:hypothetical protein
MAEKPDFYAASRNSPIDKQELVEKAELWNFAAWRFYMV